MALKLPALDAGLTGTTTLGYTTKSGQVFLQPGLTLADQASTLAHEGFHAFLTPQSGPFATLRQNIRVWGYNNSAFLQGTEEIIAETYASGSLNQGISHAFNGAYEVNGVAITRWTYFGEAAAGTAAVGGLSAGAYEAGDALFGADQ